MNNLHRKHINRAPIIKPEHHRFLMKNWMDHHYKACDYANKMIQGFDPSKPTKSFITYYDAYMEAVQ